jgi:hypothetical protein
MVYLQIARRILQRTDASPESASVSYRDNDAARTLVSIVDND